MIYHAQSLKEASEFLRECGERAYKQAKDAKPREAALLRRESVTWHLAAEFVAQLQIGQFARPMLAGDLMEGRNDG